MRMSAAYTSPLLALVARRQGIRPHGVQLHQSCHIINISHSQCKIRQFSIYSARLGASLRRRAIQQEAVYNGTSTPPEKLLKSTTVTKRPPPVFAGAPQTPSPLAKTLAPTQPSPPYIPDATINPPASTRPAELELPVREEGQHILRFRFRQARAYFTFYKRGLQAINLARKDAKLIRARMKEHQLAFERLAKENPQAAIAGGIASMTSMGSNIGSNQSMSPAPWTRAEFQLLRRSSHDISRLPVFAGLFLIFGEFLPLVMFALANRITPLLPNTVRLPSQITAMRAAMLEHRAAVEERWNSPSSASPSSPSSTPTSTSPINTSTYATSPSLSPSESLTTSTTADTQHTIDDIARYGAEYFQLGPRWWPLRLQPRAMILRNTRLYYEYLLYDDMLLGSEGVARLCDEELVTAAIERGVWDGEAGVKELRRRVQRAVLKSLRPITA